MSLYVGTGVMSTLHVRPVPTQYNTLQYNE